MMTKEFEIMLRLFGDFSFGRTSDTANIKAEAVPRIVKMAHLQGIWTCIYPQLCNAFDISKYKMSILALMSCSVRQNEFTMRILSEAEKNGIGYCLLKGIFAASLYAHPDYRISSDVDILIDPKDEKLMTEFLKSKGYEVEERARHDHHMKARHSVGGLLEVHISLYSHITDRIYFGKEEMYTQEYVRINTDGKEYSTLGTNDNLNYLTAHFLKHFVRGESSIRQMMDLLLYMKKYDDEIDFEKYNALLKRLRYDKLIATVKGIGVKYFGFDFAEDECNFENVENVLDDCEHCGLFGIASSDDLSINRMFCLRRKEISPLRMKMMLMFEDEESVFSKIFLPQQRLIELGYTYAQNKVFVPVAWMHKIFDRIFNRSKHVSSEGSKIMEKRADMMKKLNMFD